MNLKIDNKLFKYLVIISIMYFLISKMPHENIPGNNPFILTGVIVLIFYFLDQPNFIFENFDQGIAIPQTDSINNDPTKLVKKFNKDIIIPQENIINNDQTIQDQIKTLINSQANNNTTSLVNNNLNTIKPTETKPTETKPTETKPVKTKPVEIKPPSQPILENIPKQNNEDDEYEDDELKIPNQDQEEIGIYQNGMPTRAKIVADTVTKNNVESCNCEAIANKAITKFLQNRRLLDKKGMLHYADDHIGDMGYSQIKLDNYIPLGASGNGFYDSWELGQFHMINTDRWKPTEKQISKCRTDKPEIPEPMGSSKHINLMNFDYARKVTAPEEINIDYFNNKLNNN